MNNIIKDKLSRGEQVFGMFLDTPSIEDVEICGVSGFDFVIIDMEHGAIDYESCFKMIPMAMLYNMSVIVRVPIFMKQNICLDWGAHGIMIPMIRTSDQVKMCVDSLKYSPSGNRGIWLGRAANYCIDSTPGEYFTEANEKTMIVAQIETAQAAENIETILEENPLIDVAFIGASDLAQSYGYTACVPNDEYNKILEKLIGRIRALGRKVGIFTNSPTDCRHYRDLGVDLIASDMLSTVIQKIHQFHSDMTV